MESCIYKGTVSHLRLTPLLHQFKYSLFMMYLDLDELPTLFDRYRLWAVENWAPARFCRRDHLGDPREPLRTAVTRLVEEKTGRLLSGPIRLLTHLRYFGYCFNPVSFYFCFDRDQARPSSIVAEVDNTPWGERHCYVLDETNRVADTEACYEVDKKLHVSPFLDMNYRYMWSFTQPGAELEVGVRCLRGDQQVLGAKLSLKRQEIDGRSLTAALVSFPFMTGKVITAIYWQAFRLWLKKAPFYPHPDRENRSLEKMTR